MHFDTEPESHVDPAGQATQAVRVVAVPPVDWYPDGHVLHEELPASSLYLWLAPHTEQDEAAGPLYCPAKHCVEELLPSHELPATHGRHSVRVVFEPPRVWKPAAHVEHADLPAALYDLSLPHGITFELPSQLWPALHSSHAVRVLASPPLVRDPSGHVSHLDAPEAAEKS